MTDEERLLIEQEWRDAGFGPEIVINGVTYRMGPIDGFTGSIGVIENLTLKEDDK